MPRVKDVILSVRLDHRTREDEEVLLFPGPRGNTSPCSV